MNISLLFFEKRNDYNSIFYYTQQGLYVSTDLYAYILTRLLVSGQSPEYSDCPLTEHE